jgi:hypothetical protein
MPDPLLYLKSLGTAAVISALMALITAACSKSEKPVTVGPLLAAALGMVGGCWILGWVWRWPPVSALDRFVEVLIPVCLVSEILAGSTQSQTTRNAWQRSGIFLLATVGILFGSVFLDSEHVPVWRIVANICSCGILASLVSQWLVTLSRRSAGDRSLIASLCLAQFAAGFAILLGGYIKGGAIVFPLVGSLAATMLASSLVSSVNMSALIYLGVFELFGVTCIGHFFGRLTAAAVCLLLAPLLCWITELPRLQQRFPTERGGWTRGIVRIGFVAIPLAVVLVLAKSDFDKKMKPLISSHKSIPADHSSPFENLRHHAHTD